MTVSVDGHNHKFRNVVYYRVALFQPFQPAREALAGHGSIAPHAGQPRRTAGADDGHGSTKLVVPVPKSVYPRTFCGCGTRTRQATLEKDLPIIGGAFDEVKANHLCEFDQNFHGDVQHLANTNKVVLITGFVIAIIGLIVLVLGFFMMLA